MFETHLRDNTHAAMIAHQMNLPLDHWRVQAAVGY